MTNTLHIRLLAKAKRRLDSAAKRLRQAEELLDLFFTEVPDELKGKRAWDKMALEYYFLRDCRSNIRGVRHQTLRLEYQVHRVKLCERKRRRTEEDTPE